MPNTSKNQLHVDTLLSNISIKYRNEQYQAMNLFPELPVKKQSDLYRVYVRNFRVPDTRRAYKAEAKEHTFEVSSASYVLEKHSLKDHVADEDADNYDLADLRADTTEELSDKLLMRLEKKVLDLLTSTSWSLNLSLAAAGAWNATTTVDPVAHFDTGTSQVVLNSGQMVNSAAMGLTQWFALKNNAQILDRVKYTSATVGPAIVGALIGVKNLYVGAMSEDTSELGVADAIASMWPDHAFLYYKPDSAGPLKPSAGYIFRKSTPMTKRWRVEERNADAIEVNMEYIPKVVASLSGFLIKDVTA